ncbi:MAG: hypothetical protein HY048_07420 [Acidobacteria bacterium]|nr:hypothetical protein [Acidobacteriota bacterium]
MQTKRLIITLALLAACVSPAAAQTAQTDPLQCWWRTSTGAIRVGEIFTTVLTCAVLETDAATVVVDQSKLEPSVMQFAPFEVLGGTYGADLRTGARRFFQYQYRMRLIAENQFGKDVALPETKISYRVQSHVGDKTSIEGRDQSYIMPAQSVRVQSLVPADATDIRDASAETFADIDQRAFRSNLFLVVGGVLFALAGLLALLALVRVASKFRRPVEVQDQLIGDATILRGVGREFAAVRREREGGGWTPELVTRALAALRVAATYAGGGHVGHMPAGAEGIAEDGRLILKTGWVGGKRIAVSGAMTQGTITRALARAAGNGGNGGVRAQRLEALGDALTTMTGVQYGRDARLDDSALDAALSSGQAVLGRLKFEQTWIMKRLAARRLASQGDTRAWSR